MTHGAAFAESYNGIRAEIVELLDAARTTSARSVNVLMTATYWEIGRRIIAFEQRGEKRAEYGEELIRRLAADLAPRFGRGFGWRNLMQMRAFSLAWPTSGILQTASAKSLDLPSAAARFPLPWSAYVRLLSVKNPQARAFYETEALRSGWSVRQLDRQISSQFYERIALSQNKAAMLETAESPEVADAVTPEEAIKDPFVLEFLDLKDEYSESDLEEALILHLTDFLLELGDDFAFIGRQRRLRIDDTWFRIDLVFFHRRLRCLVIADLKVGKFSYADAGQMHLYLNYAREHWMKPGENPPVGLILCAEKGAAEAHYALDNLPNKVLAAEYQTVLPNEKLIAEELDRSRGKLEERRLASNRGETVLEVGAEGGSITLSRRRNAGGDWEFQMKTNDTALYDALSEEDRNSIGEYFAQTGYVRSFQESILLLDRYPWFRLHPIDIHPEFLDAVLREVKKRGGPPEERRWRETLKRATADRKAAPSQ